MVNKKILGIVVVLCCVILCQFITIVRLNNKQPEIVIKEVEVDKEVEVIEVEIIKEVEVIKEIEIIQEVPVEVIKEVEPTYTYNITSEEREMLARLVYREGNIESLECQKAIVSTVINRWQSGIWGETLNDVVYAKSQFSPAYLLSQTTPTETNYKAVDEVVKNGVTLPCYVFYFRAGYHFNWSGYVPYTSMGNTYFGYMAKDVK